MSQIQNKYNTALVVLLLLLLISAGWLIISQGNKWFATEPQAPLRPTTINNAVLRIDSNIMRIQSAMENLAYSEQQPIYLSIDIKR
jgi:hypothetical protein